MGKVLPESAGQVGVVIPAHNAATYIGEAIESVLSQTHGDVRCIVVNDRSTDDTDAIARGYPSVMTIRSERPGVAAARNLGARRAGTELLAFLDADDFWEPERLAAGMEKLEEGFDAALCGSLVSDEALRPIGRISMRPASPTPEQMLLGECQLVSCSSNLLVRTAVFHAVGGWNEALSTSADWDLLIRLAAHSRIGYTDEPLVRYRRHAFGMSRDVRLMEAEMRVAYDSALARLGSGLHARRTRRRALGALERMLAGSHFAAGNRAEFMRCAARSVAHDPRNLSYFARRLVSAPRARNEDPLLRSLQPSAAAPRPESAEVARDR
jgi:glycosyltransferase involved in cell wall biosynthesis